MIARALWIGPTVLALLSASATAAINQESENEFETLERLVTEAVVTATGAHASGIRGHADSNQDGQVSAAEADSYLEETKGTIESDATRNSISLDGGHPADLRVTAAGAEGLVGSTSSTSRVELFFDYVVEFAGVDGSKSQHVYAVKYDAQAAAVLDENVGSITVPPGYRISSLEGISAPEFSDGNRTVEGDWDEAQDLRLTFEQTGGRGGKSAAPPFVLAGGAVLGAAALRRLRTLL